MIGQERTVLPLLAERGVRPHRVHRRAHLHRRLRHREGGHQLLRRHPVGPLRPQARPRRRLAHRPPRPAAADVGADVGLGHLRQRPARRQPGPHLVDDGHHEDRPRRPRQRRGLAMGLNEAAGYGAVALTALATGFIAAARTGCAPNRSSSASPTPGSASASRPCSSARPTATPATKPPTTSPPRRDCTATLTTGEIFVLTSFQEKALSSCSPGRAGQQPQRRPRLGPVPASSSPPPASRVGRIGVLAALYPAVWGLGQLVTGALSDRIGRKWLIAGGMLTQAVAIASIAATSGLRAWALGAVAPRRRHRHGVPDPARRHRRRRPPHLAGPLRRHLPALARRRLRRRRPPRRHPRRRRLGIDAAIWAVAALTAASGHRRRWCACTKPTPRPHDAQEADQAPWAENPAPLLREQSSPPPIGEIARRCYRPPDDRRDAGSPHPRGGRAHLRARRLGAPRRLGRRGDQDRARRARRRDARAGVEPASP